MSQLTTTNAIAHLLETGTLAAAAGRVRRSDLLPHLFRIHGKQFSLQDYTPFRDMYDGLRPHKELWICGRQIGKSANVSRSEIMGSVQVPNLHTLYVAPLKEQALYYSTTYLSEAMNSCPLVRQMSDFYPDDQPYGPLLNAVMHKTLGNGSSIKLTYAKTSADRARGVFADVIDFDEIQDHLIDNLHIIEQSSSQSSYNLRRYTGTAKTADNTIDHLWRESSMAEWAMRCGCGHWNIPTREGEVWKMIRAQGPSCAKCGRLLDVRNGAFVPARPDLEIAFAGRHVPQIVIPSIAYNKRKWAELVEKVLRLPEATVLQEILGISCSLGVRMITMEDLKRVCVLPSRETLQQNLAQYALIVSGVDWGVAEQTSFTVHTVIGQRLDGKIDVLWATRYVGFDTDDMLSGIARTHAFYGASFMFADYGAGFDKNQILLRRFKIPVVQIQYTDQKMFMTYRPQLGMARYMMDRTTALQLMFLAIKNQVIRMPPWPEMEVYAKDLLSPYEHITFLQGQERRRFMRNPQLPDDFAHALCFAYNGITQAAGKDPVESAIPKGAMGADHLYDYTPPEPDTIDPLQVMRSSQGNG